MLSPHGNMTLPGGQEGWKDGFMDEVFLGIRVRGRKKDNLALDASGELEAGYVIGWVLGF